jgi:hypothetical protein
LRLPQTTKIPGILSAGKKHPKLPIANQRADFKCERDTPMAKIVAIAVAFFALGSAGYAQIPSGNLFVRYFSNTQNNVRISTGIVVHF